MTLRSGAWFDREDDVGMEARVALAMGGNALPRRGAPVIGLANSASDLNPCNLPLNDLIGPLREGVEAAGGVAVEFPVMSLGEDIMKPAAMLYRNLVAMEVEESLRSQPLDGVIVLAACDKSVPAALMGALSSDLPTLLCVAGPRPVARFRGRRVGTGTDLWRAWDERRAGEIDDEGWAEFEAALVRGRGTCNTMGTASTMGIVAETLGLAWPGSTTLDAGEPGHREVARALGERIVAMVGEERRPRDLGSAAFTNALRVLSAIGGSTNAVIHMMALAHRVGVDLRLEDVDAAGRAVPVIVDVEPSGQGLIEDLHAAGGAPAIWRALGDLLDPTVRLADGRSTAEHAQEAPAPTGVVRSLDNPLDPHGAFRVVRGNLAPDGALIKRSAATPSLLAHRGPARVLRSAAEAEAFSTSTEELDPDTVIVLAGAGPVGGPGMPEWAMVSLPPSVLARGVRDMVRVSDGRMSGTSFGTVFLHVAPEAATGGPLAAVRDGDVIRVDADAGVIEVELAPEEIDRRLGALERSRPVGRGYLSFYAEHVQQAPRGCDFDFLAGAPGVPPRLEEPVVGRS